MTTIISLIKQGVEHLRNISEDTRVIRDVLSPPTPHTADSPATQEPEKLMTDHQIESQDDKPQSKAEEVLARFRKRVGAK